MIKMSASLLHHLLEMTTYSISENPHPTILLNVEIKNLTEKSSEKVKTLWANLNKISNEPDIKISLRYDKLFKEEMFLERKGGMSLEIMGKFNI